MTRVARRFVAVDGRRVHYRRAGDGPPLVMLHGSPGNSAMLDHEIAACAARFTVFALDTPGFGDSEPLAEDVLTVGDLADATVAALDALGLPPCPIYGTHTGGLIAIELGARHPGRATGLIVEGLPIFTEAEMATIFGGYFEPMIPDPLGGHLTATWMRFRDQFTWFPWASRDVTRLNPVDRPTAEEIHLWVMMFYRSCRTYAPAYKAACFHGHRAYEAVERIDAPAIFMASAEDMLFPHLDRLPSLKAGQRIERLAYDPPAKYAAIVRYAAEFADASAAPPIEPVALCGRDPAVGLVDTADGDLFVRRYGGSTAPVLLLLHDAPGSGLALEGLARALADDWQVVLPDLPGCGESDPPAGPALDAAADAMIALADALALPRFTVSGIGCGAAVAARLAGRGDNRLDRIAVAAIPPNDAEGAAAIAPDLPLSPDGAHWVRAWLMVRDGQIYSPSFDGRVAAQRRDQGNFDARWLHDQTFEIMKARASYYLLPRAAWRFDTAAALAASGVPFAVAPDGDVAALVRSLKPTGVPT